MCFQWRKSAEPESALFQRAAQWPEHAALESLDFAVLQSITRREGVDFATALLFDRFRQSPARAKFIRQIDALRQSPAAIPAGFNAKVVIVPGALYLERPDMGGDGRIVREVAAELGLKTDLIPLVSFGSVETNAGLIQQWLRQNLQDRMILVSLSKGGADLKLAMSRPDTRHLFQNVTAWINVCGPVNGSRMANWVMESRLRRAFFRWKLRWRKRDFRFITDMRHGSAAPLDFSLNPPTMMKVVSLMGFPLSRHMTTRFSRFCHRTIAPFGPNDGTTLLADLQGVPGDIYPVWGMDHYFRPESEARNLVSAILQYLANYPVGQK